MTYQETDALGQLEGMDLTEEILHASLRAGETQRDSVTPNDVPTRGGMDSWFESIRALRDVLVHRGWYADDRDGMGLTVHPSGGFGIGFQVGDASTGDPNATPILKYRKGRVVELAVMRNQEELFPELVVPPDLGAAPMGRKTWFLLRHRRHDGVVVCELSLPEYMNDGQVTKWGRRIILRPLILDPNSSPIEPEPSPEIDISVTPRG